MATAATKLQHYLQCYRNASQTVETLLLESLEEAEMDLLHAANCQPNPEANNKDGEQQEEEAEEEAEEDGSLLALLQESHQQLRACVWDAVQMDRSMTARRTALQQVLQTLQNGEREFGGSSSGEGVDDDHSLLAFYQQRLKEATSGASGKAVARQQHPYWLQFVKTVNEHAGSPRILELFPTSIDHAERGDAEKDNAEEEEAEEEEEEVAIQAERQTFQCPVSHLTLTQPVTSSVCGHSFSKDAILSLFRHNQQQLDCPVTGCRRRFTKQDLKLDKKLARQVQRHLFVQATQHSADQHRSQSTMVWE